MILISKPAYQQLSANSLTKYTHPSLAIFLKSHFWRSSPSCLKCCLLVFPLKGGGIPNCRAGSRHAEIRLASSSCAIRFVAGATATEIGSHPGSGGALVCQKESSSASVPHKDALTFFLRLPASLHYGSLSLAEERPNSKLLPAIFSLSCVPIASDVELR